MKLVDVARRLVTEPKSELEGQSGADRYAAFGFSSTTDTPWPDPMHTPMTP
ncbi:hypothetical protein [Mycobacterium stomatepiae]|uniref:hypothetical protein n=1 Tax=Mycobacterium stomatepiae TaxID=470076 RepID=UPI0013D700E0|nr:hypothetical protein [Mycobacterium stomatepiae]MCV7167147.1 hypothetical protein [Mycobacterium stomatepiae]